MHYVDAKLVILHYWCIMYVWYDIVSITLSSESLWVHRSMLYERHISDPKDR